MSNILPKKSWHVYNDKNREKVKKDEQTASIEKERVDERSKAAEKEYRLSLLRTRADIDLSQRSSIDEKNDEKLKINDKYHERFELFPSDVKSKNLADKYGEEKERKKVNGQSLDVERDHFRNDPMLSKEYKCSSRKKCDSKKYSFV